MPYWEVVLCESGNILSVIFSDVDVCQVGNISWLRLKKCGIGCFPCSDLRWLAEIVLNQRNEFCQIWKKSHIKQIDIFCPWFNKVVYGIETLMRFQEFRTSNVVIATSPSGIDSDSLRFSINLEFHSCNAVESADCVYLRPNGEVNHSLQSVNIVKTRERTNESALSPNNELRTLPENTLLNEGVNGLGKLHTKCLSIRRK